PATVARVPYTTLFRSLPPWLGFPIGVSSGVLGGAFNMGGPPCVAYLYSRPWPKEEVVALLQVVFIISSALRLALFGMHGIVPPSDRKSTRLNSSHVKI